MITNCLHIETGWEGSPEIKYLFMRSHWEIQADKSCKDTKKQKTKKNMLHKNSFLKMIQFEFLQYYLPNNTNLKCLPKASPFTKNLSEKSRDLMQFFMSGARLLQIRFD